MVDKTICQIVKGLENSKYDFAAKSLGEGRRSIDILKVDSRECYAELQYLSLGSFSVDDLGYNSVPEDKRKYFDNCFRSEILRGWNYTLTSKTSSWNSIGDAPVVEGQIYFSEDTDIESVETLLEELQVSENGFEPYNFLEGSDCQNI